MTGFRLVVGTAAVALIFLFCRGGSVLPGEEAGDDVAEQARRLHFSSIVLDTHLDTTLKLQEPAWEFAREHPRGHVDLPRMLKGGLNAAFFSIYMPGAVTGPQAVQEALERIASVHKLVEDHPDHLSFCVTAEDVKQARSRGKIAVLMGMEGGHMIHNSLSILRMYARLGVRYLTLTHSVHTDWADSSGRPPRHEGLTEFGRDVVRELNRLGMMVDVSHVSDQTFWDVLNVSQAPVIASHSSCRAVASHPRNLSDEMIRELAAKGGVIQITFVNSFIDPDLYEYQQRTTALQRELAARYPGDANRDRRRQELNRLLGPAPRTGWQRIVDHIEHAVRVAGVDHVGLGSDFDGANMPEGMEDVKRLPRITEELLRRGYSEWDVKKVLGENTLRLMADVERVARELRESEGK